MGRLLLDFSNLGVSDNKKFKQGHFEMGIRCANFMPISNHFARKRAPLCPLIKCYLKGEFNRLSWSKFQVVAKLIFAAQLYSFFGLASASYGRVVSATVLFT
ncbi:Uncharacterised protein [Plesiomonas shigelloides]|nr:Uncharacterised protein [Plesiomonas shigelloides]